MTANTHPMAYDPLTLAAAEKVVRDMILQTRYAADANRLRRAADAIHELGEGEVEQ